MRNELGPWQGEMLVMGGRFTLINSSLASVPLYMLSFYRIPSGVKEKMNIIRNDLLWGEDVRGNEFSVEVMNPLNTSFQMSPCLIHLECGQLYFWF
jgi:hypothetical protein